MGEGRDESRTAATQPGDGVEHLLLDHRHPSDRAEDLLDGERVVFRRGLPQGERGRALPDGTGQVRYDADDPTAAGEAFLDERGADACGEGNHKGILLDTGADGTEEGGHVFRLRREDEDVGTSREIFDRLRESDPMFRRDLLGSRRDLVAHEDSGRREDVADEQTAHEGFPHLSHASNADGVLSVHANPPEPPTLGIVRSDSMAGSRRISAGPLNLGSPTGTDYDFGVAPSILLDIV